MTDNRHANQEDWTPCSAGDIAGLVGRLKSRRQRQAAGILATGSVCLLLAIGVGMLATRPEAPAAQVQLSCEQILNMAPEFYAGKLGPERSDYISEHLSHCPRCLDEYEIYRLEHAQTLLQLPDGETLLITDASHAIALK